MAEKTYGTIDTYDKYHRVYDKQVADFWENFPLRVVDKFYSSLKGRKVLDLGSGTGRGALILRRLGLNVTCFDASSSMIADTKKLGFRSVRGDFRRMKFPDESFDGVWAYTSLIHVKTPEARKVLWKVNRMLKPGGVLLIGLIRGNFEGDLVKKESMPGGRRFTVYYTDARARRLVRGLGFKLLHEKVYHYRHHSHVYLNYIYRKYERK